MLGGAGRFSAAASGAHTALAGVPLRVVLLVVSNVLAEGPGFRALVIVDDFTRGYLALVVDTSSSVRRVARELDAIVMAGGKPLMIVSDNGTEVTSYAILRWQEERGFGWHTLRAPGKPMQYALVESVNGRFHDECLDEHVFRGLPMARRIAEAWRLDYSACRPHTSLGDLAQTSLQPVSTGPQPERILVISEAVKGQGHKELQKRSSASRGMIGC
jgi:putative transposase